MAAAPGVALLFLVILLPRTGRCKECTNTPTSSHTVRHTLLSSVSSGSKFGGSFNSDPHHQNLQALEIPHGHRKAMASSNRETDGYHKRFESLLRQFGKRKLAYREGSQIDEWPQTIIRDSRKVHPIMGASQVEPLGGREDYFELALKEPFLQEVSLHDVVLHDDSTHGRAQQTNLEYLLMLDIDRLVWSFRSTSNLSTPGSPYGGWESPTSELRGHFVGHYLSAAAQIWASTHNETIYDKMTAVVDALFECQQEIGTGYLSAFPSELFDRFEQVRPVWAPYYTIHKIMAGLLDQYTLGRNSKALTMAISMADYFNERVLRVIELYTIERHWQSLNEETGGMNDVLYHLYTLTDNPKYLTLAHLFDKPCFLGLLAVQADSLSGFHANTHIPLVVGAQMRFEITGEKLYKDISSFFMDIVSTSHSYPTGGTSAGEFWTDAMHLGDTLSSTETEESCTTYNMLKISRQLFRWTRQMKYADYYERALTNGVLSIQRGQDAGVMIYMLPMGKGKSKAISYHGWGTKFESFWCCYGTGIESFSKLGDSIYFEETGAATPSLYIIQFVSSSFMWQSVGYILKQRVGDLSSSNTTLHASFEFLEMNDFGTAEGRLATLHIRIPFWMESFSSTTFLNNETLNVTLTSGEFFQVTRTWHVGDKLELFLDVLLRAEKVKDNRDTYKSVYAIFFGPYLLAGLSGGDWDITGVDLQSLPSWVTPVEDTSRRMLFTFSQEKTSGHVGFLTHSDSTLSMGRFSLEGSNEAACSTFRLVDPVAANLVSESCLRASLAQLASVFQGPIIQQWSAEGSITALLGKIVSIELFDQPGNFLVHRDMRKVETMRVNRGYNSNQHFAHLDFAFRVVSGLHFPEKYISFEAVSKPGCYLHAEQDWYQTVGLKCSTLSSDEQFQAGASFLIRKPLASYHSVSFIAKGLNKDYLLSPLMSLKDESYTVFFNITS
ncbi:hypothetical protein GOP47_0002124 [Adiantum capillus-veneris]|uniref:Alpha-L-arabinofuranosidase B arabinose-binding domain-containing protein n=1 Tax=Adiantum capillus-veneris TaxID=13818 RepID=A0A9D4V9J8_ADICA|nr:hypothetical protein GOP47_0002124 [Adiantum capillus-veneris]